MKKFVVAVFLATGILTIGEVNAIDFNDQYCSGHCNITEADVLRYTTTFEHDGSRELPCYILCSFLHMGLVNEAGDFNVDRLIEMIEETVYISMPTSEQLKVLSVCNNSHMPGDPSDKAAGVADCLFALFKPVINMFKPKLEEKSKWQKGDL